MSRYAPETYQILTINAKVYFNLDSDTTRLGGGVALLYGWQLDERAPQRKRIEDLRLARDDLHLIQASDLLYGMSSFTESIDDALINNGCSIACCTRSGHEHCARCVCSWVWVMGSE